MRFGLSLLLTCILVIPYMMVLDAEAIFRELIRSLPSGRERGLRSGLAGLPQGQGRIEARRHPALHGRGRAAA